MKAQAQVVAQPFEDAREKFESLVAQLQSKRVGGMTHSQVEELLRTEGNELLRRLFQSYLDTLGDGRVEATVKGVRGPVRTHLREIGRNIKSLFGTVRLKRFGYGARESSPLVPLDAELNLPDDVYSLGTRKRVAQAAAKGSFAEVVNELQTTTGTTVPKRQVEELTVRAAQDFDSFYEKVEREAAQDAASTGPILVITSDAKGIVMRPDALRPATRKAAEKREHKLTTRLSKGEKRNSKRMAEVASVYTLEPYIRKPEDVIADARPVRLADEPQRPRPEHKRVWASVTKDAEEVIDEAFEEALRRDPRKTKQWVVLVDGQPQQLVSIKAMAKKFDVDVRIVVDFIHVLEYLWQAGRSLCGEGPASETWVKQRALRLLRGEVSTVAAGIRRSATLKGLTGDPRKAVDKCANYLLKNARHLRYDECLAHGYPIATGVIEGACRHLVKDRMDLTGARWKLERAEAVLKLRSLRSSGDFESYWQYHEEQEYKRNHSSKYWNDTPPKTTRTPSTSGKRQTPHLRIVP